MPRMEPPQIDERAAAAHNLFLLEEYVPPADKRWLVILQCSVRRPFSSSPSHASMRRAIALATGHDPKKAFERCPVHVVVLASHVGPVPYELEDTYPANVRSTGVKHMDEDELAEKVPMLVERVAAYVVRHKGAYDRIATFTEGRYREVMEAVRRRSGLDMRILPIASGPEVIRYRGAPTRFYWQRYWIQLYREIVGWLAPGDRRAAEERFSRAGAVLA